MSQLPALPIAYAFSSNQHGYKQDRKLAFMTRQRTSSALLVKTSFRATHPFWISCDGAVSRGHESFATVATAEDFPLRFRLSLSVASIVAARAGLLSPRRPQQPCKLAKASRDRRCPRAVNPFRQHYFSNEASDDCVSIMRLRAALPDALPARDDLQSAEHSPVQYSVRQAATVQRCSVGPGLHP